MPVRAPIEWMVTIDVAATVDQLTDDHVHAVRVALQPYAGVPARDSKLPESRVGITVTVAATSLRRAVEAGIRVVRSAILTETGLDLDLVGLQARLAAEPDRRTRTFPIPDLVTLAEVAELAGFTRQRAYQIAGSDPTFPPPAARPRSGLLYRRWEIDAWIDARRGAGRPRAGAAR